MMIVLMTLCLAAIGEVPPYPVPQVVSNAAEIGYVRVFGADRAASAKAEHSDRKVGLVASRVSKDEEGYDDRPTRDREIFAAIRAKLDYFEFDTPLPDVVSIQMHDAGVKTVRVIDDPEDVRSDADLGVKYLVSPDPDRTRRVLADLQRRMQGPVAVGDFRIRDPFVFADGRTQTYYLYETTPWNTGRGVNVRTSNDLKTWSAPKRSMTMPSDVRCRSVWAPEVHAYKGSYYLFATPTLEPDPAYPIRSMADDPSFRPPECYALTRRGTWIWKSDSPEGPFALVSDGSATPHDFVALDGTLSVDPDGTPWMVYSHCWTQVQMGRVEAARLKPDLSGLAESPRVLFRADAAFGDNHVMDGPFLYRSPKSGALFMIWSKFCSGGYSVVSCRSESGGVAGPWGDFRMVFPGNGGHGMIFRTFDGKLKLVMHKPEVRGHERLTFFDLEDTGEALRVVGSVVRPRAFHRAETRAHVGIPSIAVSPANGRLWVTWYNGRNRGEDFCNYVSLVTSADGGRHWKEVLIADPDEDGPRRAFDPEVWVAPDGKLRWTWTERLCDPSKGDPTKDYGLDIGDEKTDVVKMATLSAEEEPAGPVGTVDVGRGVMMCKPIVLKGGEWLFPLAHWREAPSSCFYVSRDNGATFSYRGGVTIPEDCRLYDEHQAVERTNGDLVAFIRPPWRQEGRDFHPLMSVSKDAGKTWSEPVDASYHHVSSRTFVSRLKSGNWLLVKHGPVDRNVGRKELTAYLSADEGRTWKGGLLLDERLGATYPDGQQLPDGSVVVVYDNDRLGAKEILFAAFAEEDVLAGRDVSGKVRLRNVITSGNVLR